MQSQSIQNNNSNQELFKQIKQEQWNKLFQTFLFIYSCNNKYDFYNNINTENILPRILQPVYSVSDEEFQEFKNKILTELQQSISILEDTMADETEN